MILFLDTEFTGLFQNTELISLALVSNDGRYFYAEFNDYDTASLSNWHKENVLPFLVSNLSKPIDFPQSVTYHFGDTKTIVEKLKRWLKQWSKIKIWADVPAYDWVLFCELFGGALYLPPNIHFILRDLATFFELKGYDPNIERFSFIEEDFASEFKIPLNKHNALADAWGGLQCLKKLKNN